MAIDTLATLASRVSCFVYSAFKLDYVGSTTDRGIALSAHDSGAYYEKAKLVDGEWIRVGSAAAAAAAAAGAAAEAEAAVTAPAPCSGAIELSAPDRRMGFPFT